MLTNLELYGTKDVTPIPKKIVSERIALLEVHLTLLQATSMVNREHHLIKQVSDAITHWTKLGADNE